MTIDLGQVARQLKLPTDKVERTANLLDAGNTVPFITRYRKDQTGGLDEEQIRAVQQQVAKARMLAERKATILKSIESQGKLTPELAEQINAAATTRRLEDLYLPYKPKKQTLATMARERGLDPLAREILNAAPAAADLENRARDFIHPDKQIESAAEALLGAGHILAERYSENAVLRERLRKIFHQTGKLVSTRIEPAAEKRAEPEGQGGETPSPKQAEQAASEVQPAAPSAQDSPAPAKTPDDESSTPQASAPANQPEANADDAAKPQAIESAKEESGESPSTAEQPPAAESAPEQSESQTPSETDESAGEKSSSADVEQTASAGPEQAEVKAPGEAKEPEKPNAEGSSQDAAPEAKPAKEKQPREKKPKQKSAARRKSKAEKKRQKLEAAFKDYYDYSEPVDKVPPHRVLAINRGEKAKVLRVKIEADADRMQAAAEELVIPVDHPHADFLRGCVRDALQRLVVPGLEREVRREMTERAEQHAVEVFARNLRQLLLQPPVHGHRVLAIDPGFKNGCKLAALDQFGNVLDSGLIHVVGSAERRKQGREKIVELVRKHDLSVVAIGNGTGCRESEELAADILASELQDRDVAYVVVNEAGASVYSTSDLGREELPQFDATLRGAVSIGRRLLDPLSELVKINPANIGVGMYQHDVKARHLRDSLNAVVESCVNYVGVDANTASPALLRYVSGLNQLTARRLYEHRRDHGPFKTREQLKEATGFGEATFVQAAGFLKISQGENPLDATWIHPESYDAARRVLEQVGCSVEELGGAVRSASPAIGASLSPEPAPESNGSTATAADSSEADKASAEQPQASTTEPPAAKEDADAVKSAAEETTAEQKTEPSGVAPQGETPSAEQPTPRPDAPSPQPHDAAPIPPGEGEQTTGPAASEQPPVAEKQSPASEKAGGIDMSTKAPHPEAVHAPAPVVQKIAERTAQIDVRELARQLDLGELTLKDILSSLTRPGRDPREDLEPPVFRRGILKLEDLEPGMELTGTVLNVVDFGAFVDIGLSDSGLVHISRLADRYVRDPHEVVSVGDILKVWVLEVDQERRRVSLTAIEPGAEKPKPRRERPPRGKSRRRREDRGRGAGKQSRPPRGGKRESRAPRKPPKPAPPITKSMEEGKEPMRSFSDLLQFMEKKKPDEKSDK